MIRDEKSTQQGPEQRLFADPEALKELVTVMVQTILNEEQARFLGAGPYERSQGRRGHRNGTKPRSMKTRVGKIGFEVPQVRGAEEPFRPSLFERFQRTEKALLVTLQEMYVKGVSTREVAAVMEQMGGFEVSAQAVSQAAAQLDEAVKRWRERELSLYGDRRALREGAQEWAGSEPGGADRRGRGHRRPARDPGLLAGRFGVGGHVGRGLSGPEGPRLVGRGVAGV